MKKFMERFIEAVRKYEGCPSVKTAREEKSQQLAYKASIISLILIINF